MRIAMVGQREEHHARQDVGQIPRNHRPRAGDGEGVRPVQSGEVRLQEAPRRAVGELLAQNRREVTIDLHGGHLQFQVQEGPRQRAGAGAQLEHAVAHGRNVGRDRSRQVPIEQEVLAAPFHRLDAVTAQQRQLTLAHRSLPVLDRTTRERR